MVVDLKVKCANEKCGAEYTFRNRKKIDGLCCSWCEAPLFPINKTRPLLTIELQSYGDVPKVFYKGEEIKNKVYVGFEWETNTDDPLPKLPTIHIRHDEADGDYHSTKTICHSSPFKD
jgi:hypothetical protein